MRAATMCQNILVWNIKISIHAAHAGCDRHTSGRGRMKKFQSTQPMRAATKCMVSKCQPYAISIHAAHAGCDNHILLPSDMQSNFNPRSPCGLRLQIQRIIGRLHNSASELALFFVYTCVVKKEPTAGKSFLCPFLKIRE